MFRLDYTVCKYPNCAFLLQQRCRCKVSTAMKPEVPTNRIYFLLRDDTQQPRWNQIRCERNERRNTKREKKKKKTYIYRERERRNKCEPKKKKKIIKKVKCIEAAQRKRKAPAPSWSLEILFLRIFLTRLSVLARSAKSITFVDLFLSGKFPTLSLETRRVEDVSGTKPLYTDFYINHASGTPQCNVTIVAVQTTTIQSGALFDITNFHRNSNLRIHDQNCS